MKKIKMILKLMALSVFLIVMCIGNNSGYASTIEDKTWSFQFEDRSVTEVLKEIHKISGIEIVLNGEVEIKPVTKSYTNDTIDNILADIFYGKNVAALFNYSNHKLMSVNIWILPEAGPAKFNRYVSNGNENVKPMLIQHFQDPQKIQQSMKSKGIKESAKRRYTENSPGTSDLIYGYSLPADKTNKPVYGVENEKEKYNSKIKEEKNEYYSEIVNVPPPPEPEKYGGLEPPPMPPVMALNNK